MLSSIPHLSTTHLIRTTIQTKLGEMEALADDNFLYYLNFSDHGTINTTTSSLKINSKLYSATNTLLEQLKNELQSYLHGSLKIFTIPLYLNGTESQKLAWKKLQEIPYGQTRSYKQQAQMLGNVKAHRAVANCNARNKIIILIPCHRVINSNGTLGGYSAGLERKKTLLEIEGSC